MRTETKRTKIGHRIRYAWDRALHKPYLADDAEQVVDVEWREGLGKQTGFHFGCVQRILVPRLL